MGASLLQLRGSFAHEMRGMNLWDPLDGDGGTTLRNAFAEHPLLVFRRQSLREDELVAFGKALGVPREYVERSWWSSRPEVSVVSNMHNGARQPVGGLSSRELNWHTDQSYNASPVTGCFLYAQVVPETGSRTSWASLYGAYDALPDEWKERLEGAVGTFSYAARTGSVIPGADGKVVQQSYDERIRSTPDVRHAMVHTHPVSGRRAVYMDPGTLIAVDGMTRRECDELFELLLDCATREGNVYHHDWQVGDLVLWDNAVTLHRRDAFADEQGRLLKRMIIDLPGESHIRPTAL